MSGALAVQEYQEGASVGKVRPDRLGSEWGAIGVQFDREATLDRDRLVTFMRCRRAA